MPHLDKSLDSASQTLKAASGRSPALAAVFSAFEPLFVCRKTIANDLAKMLAEAGTDISAFNYENSKAGVPMMSAWRPPAWAVKFAAEKILPLLVQFPAVGEHGKKLKKFFLSPVADNDAREELGAAILAGAPIASPVAEIPAHVMDFASQFIYSAVFRAAAALAPLENGEPLWDKEGVWKQGYCPFCGSFPVIAWLDKAKFDVKNEFLASGGGKKHYHCSLCGSSWKFRRGVCPACGKEGENAVNILNIEGKGNERIDWCGHCKSYCPTVDLRELAHFPDMDAMALGMAHLDMAAAERCLHPLKSSFWNKF